MAFESAAYMYDIYSTARIRQMNGADIIAAHGDYAADQFAAAAEGACIPVIVPARNEQDDLPATLYSLARSGDAVPIVVLNGTTDATGEAAESMGAIVIEAAEGARKVGATQAGMHYAYDVLGSPDALATDADTLIPKIWPRAMRAKLATADEGAGAAVFATGITWHGNSPAVDAVRTGLRAARNVKRNLLNQPAGAHGYDYGVRFGAEGQVMAVLDGMDPEQFVGDDCEFARRVVDANIPAIGAVSLSTAVITLGDRMGTFGDLWAQRPYANLSRQASYAAQYGSDAQHSLM